MENYQLDHDIKTMYVTATSFPEGIMAAHEKLHSLIPSTKERRFFGISRPDRSGTIVYKAAVEVLNEEEAGKTGLDTFIIPKGTYTSTYIANYADDIQQVGRTFDQLLADPALDSNGFCLEMYMGEKDMRCMVRLDTGNVS
ncbi:hypothetical protein [Chitinophaga sp. MM2321]|uniref:hypothetical protein n=1 Tax=Chitinophaga sp. MM2321 TaxID=3137178 RepID=UPI0032D59077